jgi:hypothetical protein
MKIRIFGDEVVGCGVQISKVASAATGDPDFLADGFVVFEDGDLAAALAGLNSAHQSGGASADDDNIEIHN